jgi:hypothetical protein
LTEVAALRTAARTEWIRFLALIFVLVGIANCILFVSPSTGGPDCAFQGAETDCGKCLTAHCQSAINSACLDDTVLSLVQECATKGDQACEIIPQSDVATCLASQCGALCYSMVGQSRTNCTESAESLGLGCSCTYGSNTNSLDCSDATYPRTRCCAPLDWPAAGETCSCNPVDCSTDTSGDHCSCSIAEKVSANSTGTCTGRYCCTTGNTCVCSDSMCPIESVQVCECDRGAFGCPAQTKAVDSCAIRD